jgi:hypothetical protein
LKDHDPFEGIPGVPIRTPSSSQNSSVQYRRSEDHLHSLRPVGGHAEVSRRTIARDLPTALIRLRAAKLG